MSVGTFLIRMVKGVVCNKRPSNLALDFNVVRSVRVDASVNLSETTVFFIVRCPVNPSCLVLDMTNVSSRSNPPWDKLDDTGSHKRLREDAQDWMSMPTLHSARGLAGETPTTSISEDATGVPLVETGPIRMLATPT